MAVIYTLIITITNCRIHVWFAIELSLISAPIGLSITIGQYTSQSEHLNDFFVNTCKNFPCFFQVPLATQFKKLIIMNYSELN